MRKRKAKDLTQVPAVEKLETELKREKYRRRYLSVLRSTVYTLLVVAAAAVLIATLWLPVLQIYGNSMSPTLIEGDILVSLKSDSFNTGDVVAFYYNNRILVKRVIAGPGDWVDIDRDGNVYVNEELIEEPYLVEKAFGICDLELPYQVPENKFFVMGDHRSVANDSRLSAIGCVASGDIVGRLVFRVWPVSAFGVF